MRVSQTMESLSAFYQKFTTFIDEMNSNPNCKDFLNPDQMLDIRMFIGGIQAQHRNELDVLNVLPKLGGDGAIYLSREFLESIPSTDYQNPANKPGYAVGEQEAEVGLSPEDVPEEHQEDYHAMRIALEKVELRKKEFRQRWDAVTEDNKQSEVPNIVLDQMQIYLDHIEMIWRLNKDLDDAIDALQIDFIDLIAMKFAFYLAEGDIESEDARDLAAVCLTKDHMFQNLFLYHDRMSPDSVQNKLSALSERYPNLKPFCEFVFGKLNTHYDKVSEVRELTQERACVM